MVSDCGKCNQLLLRENDAFGILFKELNRLSSTGTRWVNLFNGRTGIGRNYHTFGTVKIFNL